MIEAVNINVILRLELINRGINLNYSDVGNPIQALQGI